MYYVYILKSLKTGECYKGLTDNINRRVDQHFSGKVRCTRIRLPLKLIFVQICENRVEARVLEKYLKSGGGREIICEIEEI